jgi:hypothetical protein
MDQTVLERRRPGRPSKGDRTELRGRVATHLQIAATRRATELGLHLNDYMAMLVSKDTGVPLDTDEGLPLGLSA